MYPSCDTSIENNRQISHVPYEQKPKQKVILNYVSTQTKTILKCLYTYDDNSRFTSAHTQHKHNVSHTFSVVIKIQNGQTLNQYMVEQKHFPMYFECDTTQHKATLKENHHRIQERCVP